MATYITNSKPSKCRNDATGEIDTLTIITERDKKTHEPVKIIYRLRNNGDWTEEELTRQWSPVWD